MPYGARGLIALKLILPLLVLCAAGTGIVEARTPGELLEAGHVYFQKAHRTGLGPAHDLFVRALQEARKAGDRRGEALARLALGRVRLEIRSGAGAAAYLELARELFRSLGDLRKEAETELGLGEAYAILGETEDARASFERALELARSPAAPGPRISARAHAGLARSFAARYAYDEAIHHLERARRAWLDLGERRRVREASLELGRLHLRVGRPRRAIEVLTEAAEETQGDPARPIPVKPEAVRAYFEDLHDPPEELVRELEETFEGFEDGGVPPWAKELVLAEPPTFEDDAYAARRLEILRRTGMETEPSELRPVDGTTGWVAPSQPFLEAFVRECRILHSRLPDQSQEVQERLAREIPGRESGGRSIFTFGTLDFRKLTPAWPSECGPRKGSFDPEAVEIREPAEPSQTVQELYPELAHRSIEEAIAEREAELERSGMPQDANLLQKMMTSTPEQKELIKDLMILRAHQGMSKIAETVVTVEASHGMREKLDLAMITGEGMPRALHHSSKRAGGRALITERHLETVQGMCRQAREVELLDTLGRAWSELGPGYADEAEAAREASWRTQRPLLEALSFFGLPTERLDVLRQRGEPFLAIESCDRRSSFVDRRRLALWRGRISLAEGDLPLGSALFRGAWRGRFVERINHPVGADAANALRSRPELEIEALTGLAEAHERQGLPTLAVLYYRKAIELAESMRGALREERMSRSFAGVQTGLYGRVIDLLVGMGEDETAFGYAERARARAFLDLLGNRRLDLRGVPDELDDAWNDLRRELAEVQARERELGTAPGRFGRSGHSEELLRLRRRQEALEDRLQDLQGQLRRRHPATASFVSVEPVPLEALRGPLIRDGTTLVSYFLTPTQGLAWVVEPGSSRVVELDLDRAKLEGQVEALRHEIAARRVPGELLEQLYRKLVAPLLPSISTDRLLLVPHGPLHSLPFAALRNPSTGRYLVEDYDLTLLPSASVIPYVLERLTPWEERPLIVGDPDGSLPAAGHEARTVAALYGAEPLLGAAARESEVRSAAGNLDVLHLAAHGRFSSRRPLFSYVALAVGDEGNPRDDGRLEVLEVMNELHLEGSNLVVLSACNSSVGRRSRGDDVVSMPRALLYAGSPSVVSTLWSIDDRASARLMESFHRHLLAGPTGAAEALRAAQLDLLRDERTASPYFWAGFALTGDPVGRAEAPVRSPEATARRSAGR